MDLNFINRVLKTTGIVTIIVALFAASYYNIHFVFGFVTGSIWNIINFWLIRLLIERGLSNNPVEKSKIAFLLLVKFPLLYGIGYVIVRYGKFTAGSLLCGFSLLFIVVILKTLGLVIMSKQSAAKTNPTVERK